MEKLIDRTVWFASSLLYVLPAAKCVMLWDGGSGAAKVGAILPPLLLPPLLASLSLWLTGKFQHKIVIDGSGTPALRKAILLTLALFIYISAVILFVPPDAKLHMACIVCGIGVFMVLLGALMPKLPRNRLIGARYSWTVADPGVWKKSNAVGGVYTALLGTLLIVSGAIPQPRSPFTAIEIGAVILYVALLTLHSRLIALKAGIGRPE